MPLFYGNVERVIPIYAHSRSVRGRSSPRFRNCFHAGSSHCLGSRAIGHYSRCATAETLPAVDGIILHPVGQSCSPGSISLLSRYLAGIWTPSLEFPLLQSKLQQTWEMLVSQAWGQLWRSTSWMASRTPESPLPPKLTLAWTSTFPINTKPTGSRTPN